MFDLNKNKVWICSFSNAEQVACMSRFFLDDQIPFTIEAVSVVEKNVLDML